jgi:DNA invertase Pin-like site-specific DNA recombinase
MPYNEGGGKMPGKVRKIEAGKPLPKLLRVAAYARVSSGKDAMLRSLSAQISHYSAYIQNQPGWLCAGVYADEAMTGTKDSRPQFQRLMSDCRDGKIDLIITKSISRFARNTVTLLNSVRELKGRGVDVYFEEHGLHTLSGEGELLLALLASFAQEESLSDSENCKWRIRKSFAKGELVNLRFLYGYHVSKGKIEIYPEEAKVVRNIFCLFLAGMGALAIAKKLNKGEIPSFSGGKWNPNSVLNILKNEKYTGNSLLQKTFIADHLSKKKLPNKGQLAKYYAKDTYPAIIGEETFAEAAALLKERKKRFYITAKPPEPYPFTGKILCRHCGKKFRRKTTAGKHYWQCPTFLATGKDACGAKQIPEEILLLAATEVLGLVNFNSTVFAEKISAIQVPEANRLLFVFQDGHAVEKTWQGRSRRESWTEEMKEKARQKALAQQGRRN